MPAYKDTLIFDSYSAKEETATIINVTWEA